MPRQTWFVTGAASTIGIDIVRAALAAGHGVVAADPDPAALRRRLGPAAGNARLLALDLDEADARAVAPAVQAALERFGSIDVLVHGAAAASPRDEFDAAPAPRRDFAASVRALFNITRGALAPMRERGHGTVWQLVPPHGFVPGPSLFSIAGFCDAVGADVASHGIVVQAVEPGELGTVLRAARATGRGEYGETLEEV